MSDDPPPAAPSDHGNGKLPGLRAWFFVYVVWLACLCGLAVWAQARREAGLPAAERVWLGAVYLFYVSLCCTFFPLPTAWIVMLLASQDARLIESVHWCVPVVATMGAFATGVANLNEYHIWTYILQFRTVGRVRETRLYVWARACFDTAPFAVLVGFSFIPIPVDVVRWLAVACRYPRGRFFLAYFAGRWVRYGLLALGTVWLDLCWWHILLVQGGIVLLAAVKVVLAYLARRDSAAISADTAVGGVRLNENGNCSVQDWAATRS